MTPTEQDKELRDNINSIVYGADWKTELGEDAHLPQTEAIMEIVRKRELQAVLDELYKNDVIEKRIAELKKKLEKYE